MSRSWNIPASTTAKNTVNRIRSVVDGLRLDPNPDKEQISLGIGDPTRYGNFDTCPEITSFVAQALISTRANGYPPCNGYPEARAAVAQLCSTAEESLSPNDILIASGASGALEIAIAGLASPGQNILIPKPGFTLYETIAGNRGIQVKTYNLLPESDWEIDLEHVRSIVDDQTAAIVLVNPSNPCGSVYSAAHLQAFLAVCEECCVPVIADEIYAHMVFDGFPFHPLASLSKNVPILSIGGIAKRYLVPGWRLGWIVVHDRHNRFAETRKAIYDLSQVILGANSVIQAALPKILLETPKSFLTATNKRLAGNARITVDRLKQIDGLTPIEARGAMYIMVKIDKTKIDVKDDSDFMVRLMNEQSVFVLAGSMFNAPDFFRIVFCAPADKLNEAYDRIAAFCNAHRKAQ